MKRKKFLRTTWFGLVWFGAVVAVIVRFDGLIAFLEMTEVYARARRAHICIL